MPKNKIEKKILTLNPEFNDVLVSQNGKSAPFIEIFVAEPENIFQENLGIIVGIFEVTDRTEDSSYIVNYLISVIRKEYFSTPKRGSVESFEAALHKVNLALSKLAEHGNVGWIGKLNGACAVIEKNNLHFSQTGTADIFLLRAGSFSNISESDETSENQNPLKTFQDVVSGRMEKDDKIILTTQSIFEIFSPDEIKKSALRFSRAEFVQFLRTALINELDQAAVLVIDIREKEIAPASIPNISKKKINAFSQEAFSKVRKDRESEKEEKNKALLENDERKQIIKEIKEEYEKTRGEFVDKKTGHIYIKEDISPKKENSTIEDALELGGKIWNKKQDVLGFMKGKRNQKKTVVSPERIQSSSLALNSPENSQSQERISSQNDNLHKEFDFTEKIAIIGSSLASFLLIVVLKIKTSSIAASILLWQKVIRPLGKNIRAVSLQIFSKRTAVKEKIAELKEKALKREKERYSPPSSPVDSDSDYLERSASREEKRDWFQALSRNSPRTEKEFFVASEQTQTIWKKILPDFSKMKEVFSQKDFSKKIAAFLLIILIFIVPYFIAKFWPTSSKETPQKNEVAAPPVSLPLEQDRNVSRVENLSNIYQGDASLGVIGLNGKFFAVGKNSIESLDDLKNYPIPENFVSGDLAFGMDDLNLIFILKNKKIISFSGVSGKFQDNNINIPQESEIVSGRAYLTYAYLLDGNSGQIYRFPRAEGGFGEKSDWIKENLDLSGAKDLAINENVFVVENGKVLKFFQGKIQDFQTEESATPIIAEKIWTRPESQNLYALDKANSRIVKFDSNGQILNQYYDSSLSLVSNFSVDEEKNLIYLSTQDSVRSFEMK